VSDALVVTGNFVRQLVDIEGGLDPTYKGCAIQLYDRVLSILQEQNIAQEVKQACIVCIAKIVVVSHEVLTPAQINQVYNILSEKCNAELTRESALKAMNLIASNENNVIGLTGLDKLEGQLITMMSNANRSVRLATLEVILTFLRRYTSQMGKAAPNLQKNLTQFINENDIQAAQYALACANLLVGMSPNASGPTIEATIKLCKGEQIQGHAIIDDLEKFFCSAVKSKVVDMNMVGNLMA
jgi:hypothetical protein